MSQSPVYRGVIFDLNGVLMDTIGIQYESWRMMLEEYGIGFSPQEYREQANGVTRVSGLRNILGDDATEDRLAAMSLRKDEILHQLVRDLAPDDHRVRLLPGVEEFLRLLNKSGIRIAVASSSKNVALMLQCSGADVYFDAIVTANDYTKSKPDPELYLVACGKLGLVPEQCILVEDSSKGVEAAKSIHMQTVGLTRTNDVKEGMADLTLDSLRQYKVIMQRFFPEAI